MLAGATTPISGATITSKTTGGPWATGSTWVGGVVPSATDNATIATTTGNSVSLGANAVCTTLKINTGATLLANSYTLTVNGNFVKNGTFTAGTGTVVLGLAGAQSISGTTTTFNNLTITGSGTKTLTTRPTINGIFSVEGGATASTYATYGANATLQYKATTGDKTMGPELRRNTTTFQASGGLVIDAGAYKVTLNENKTTFRSNIHIKSGMFDLSSFTLNRATSGGSLTIDPGATMRIGTTRTLPSGYTAHSIASTSTVEYYGSNQIVTTPNSSQSYGNLILSGSGTKTIQIGVTSISGDFTTSGSITTALPVGMTFNGKVVLGSGTTVTAGAFVHTLNGDFEDNGSTFTTTGSTLEFNGSSAQTIGGSSASTFDNLTLNNPAGLTINSSPTVNGILTLSNGLLNTGSNLLTLDCTGSTANASAASYVNGKMAIVFCSPGSKTFPIGKGGNYRPLSMDYTTLTGTSTVTAEQMEGNLPGTIPDDIELFSTRYWQLSETGGSSYSFNLTLDGTGWSPTSYLKILKGDGSTNTYHTATTPYFTNSTAFTSFGYFGLGQLKWVTWLGNSNNWHSASNWTSETIPLSTDDIRIPTSAGIMPIVSGSSPANDVSLAGTGKLQVEAGANLTLESGPLLTFQSSSMVTTGSGSKIILKSDARYLNLSTSTPTLEVKRQLTGTMGWRMLSSPVATTFADMFKYPLVTQGFLDSNEPTLQPNLLWWDETSPGTTLQSWWKPANIANSVNSGVGYFHYVFDGHGKLDLNGEPIGFYTDTLPITMSTTGVENFSGSGTYGYNLTFTAKSNTQEHSETNTTYYDLNSMDEGWNLIGNPTASTLDWNAASGWTKTGVDNAIYMWDPTESNYLFWNGEDGTFNNGLIPPFQAFWVHATAEFPTLEFTNAVKSSATGTFLRSSKTDSTISIPLSISLGTKKTTSFITFSEDGIKGPDRKDAYQLQSMSDTWLNLYSLSSAEHVSPLVINNLPYLEDELTTIPLYYDAQLTNPSINSVYELNWKLPENWPTDWYISLQDHTKGTSISMTENTSYSFGSAVRSSIAEAKLPLPQKLVQTRSNPTLLRSSSNLPPFTIVISKGKEIEYMAPKPQLIGTFPNPFGQSTSVRFSLPEKANVQLEVLSFLGKRITKLADGVYPAGITDVQWNAENLVPGVYFLRFVCGESVLVEKMIHQ